MKLPIITTKNVWTEDILGDAPVFVPKRKVGEISRAVIHLMKQPKEQMMIAERVYSKVASKRSWDNIVRKHLEIHNQIILVS
ncbi:MAG: glycosyltransferase [archaeon]